MEATVAGLFERHGKIELGCTRPTKTLAVEWSRSHVRVNAVAPGLIDSGGLISYGTEGQAKYFDAAKATPTRTALTIPE